MKIYWLYHYYEDKDFYEYLTDIAYYSTKEKAQEAKNKFKKHPTFIKKPNKLFIQEIVLDKSDWNEGFTSF